MSQTDPVTASHIAGLRAQLQQEHPILGDLISEVCELDRIAHKMGVLPGSNSFVTGISWWPLVSVLGTFSSGKSSFINYYLGHDLQRTGNQAVDERFTVICHGPAGESRCLPGVSLDSDLRFPFYRISEAIDVVAPGEGRRLDTYIQLKTSPSPRLDGRILIDSPGFDADRQRDATLRITDHIVDLSDLVLVFFDARHPEPGAMRDTLQHLVADVLARPDVGKFLFILNQMDMTARENNPEEVVAAWQRAMSEAGFVGSQFHCIYNPEVCVEIPDEGVRRNFESRRDESLAKIVERLDGVDVLRSYRIVANFETIARHLLEVVGPRLASAVGAWRRLVFLFDASLLLLFAVLALWITNSLGYWDGMSFSPPWWDGFRASHWLFYGVIVAAVVLSWYLHTRVRKLAARFVRKGLAKESTDGPPVDLAAGFDRSVRGARSLLNRRPAGFGAGLETSLRRAVARSDEYIQRLNDHHASSTKQ